MPIGPKSSPWFLLWPALALMAACAAQAQQPGPARSPGPAFLARVLGEPVPAPSLLWLTPEIRAGASRILGHAPAVLRLRYWRRGDKSAWILKEIGKEEPITAGFVIEDGHLLEVSVLDYRESRGWEIRYANFRDQFVEAKLGPDMRLNRHIDGISGATLSVRAMQKMARLALYLDQKARQSP